MTKIYSNFKTDYIQLTYLFIINNINTRKRCETCSNLTIKFLERRQFFKFSDP